MEPLAKIVVGPFTSTILKIHHFGSLHSLERVFVVKGIIMICMSLVGFAAISHEPVKSRWLCLEEKDMIMARLKSERIGQTALLDSMNKLKLVRGLVSPVALVMGFVLLLTNITTNSFASLESSIVKAAYPKTSGIRQHVLSAPAYMVRDIMPETIAPANKAESRIRPEQSLQL